jgi:hypothetical protein
MINSELPSDAEPDRRIPTIIAEGPRGAVALAGITTFVVIALWFAFYLFVFMPRGALQ